MMHVVTSCYAHGLRRMRIALLQHDIVELTGSLSANNKRAPFSLTTVKP